MTEKSDGNSHAGKSSSGHSSARRSSTAKKGPAELADGQPVSQSKPNRVVHHHTPHRTRIKLPKAHRSPATLKKVEDSVKKLPGIQAVDVNHKTGSVIVHHDERADMLPAVSTAIEEVAGEIFETILEIEGVEIPGLSIVAHLLGTNMNQLNISLQGVTRGLLDLKTLLPMGFLMAGLHAARRNPGWWGDIPAWALFYYAYDSYLKFHPMVPSAVTEAAAVQTEVLTETDVSKPARSNKSATKGGDS